MIPANELVRLFEQAWDEKWGYIWGMSGQTWTAARQSAATRDMTVKYGKKWIGKRVADCSGLFVWAYREKGESIYHGSNTIWNKHLRAKGEITNGMGIRPGTAVFRCNSSGNRYHMGLYAGAGEVIEAHGTVKGVIRSTLSGWDEWGELALVDYTGVAPETVRLPPPTLKSGSRGTEVTALQERLIRLGLDPGKADGIFGPNTRSAVKAFQKAADIAADGIVGPDTWAALNKAEDTADADVTVCIPHLTKAEADGLLRAWPEAYIPAKGRDTDG